MMHTPETQLSLYAGGELDASEALPVAGHLEQCAECRKKADELRVAAEWLKSLAVEPEAGEINRLCESLLQKKHRGWPLWWPGAVAASLAFVLVGILLFRPGPAPLPEISTTTTLPPLISIRRPVTPLILPSRDREGAVKTAGRRSKSPAPRLTLFAKNSEDMPVVRVRTSDPNVVILWVVGGGSEQEKEQ